MYDSDPFEPVSEILDLQMGSNVANQLSLVILMKMERFSFRYGLKFFFGLMKLRALFAFDIRIGCIPCGLNFQNFCNFIDRDAYCREERGQNPLLLPENKPNSLL